MVCTIKFYIIICMNTWCALQLALCGDGMCARVCVSVCVCVCVCVYMCVCMCVCVHFGSGVHVMEVSMYNLYYGMHSML